MTRIVEKNSSVEQSSIHLHAILVNMVTCDSKNMHRYSSFLGENILHRFARTTQTEMAGNSEIAGINFH